LSGKNELKLIGVQMKHTFYFFHMKGHSAVPLIKTTIKWPSG